MDSDTITVDILWEAEHDEPPSAKLDAFCSELLCLLKKDDVELSLLITDDAKMIELNKSYRKKDRTTDVLSFPSAAPAIPGQPKHLGDIVISRDQAAKQAEELGQSLDVELRFLTLHGVLHLLGYDHETDDGEMLAFQSELKGKLAHYFDESEEEPIIG